MEQLIETVVREAMNAVVPLLVSALLGAIGGGAMWLRKLHINATVARALARAAGAGYVSLVRDARGVDETSMARAVQVGVDLVEGGPSVVPLLPKAGISPDRLGVLIEAEIGRLLPADPGISVGGRR